MVRGMLLHGSQIGREYENSHWDLEYFDLFGMRLYGIHQSEVVARTGVKMLFACFVFNMYQLRTLAAKEGV